MGIKGFAYQAHQRQSQSQVTRVTTDDRRHLMGIAELAMQLQLQRSIKGGIFSFTR